MVKRREILHIIKALSEKARIQDPLDRVLKTKLFGQDLFIYLSENQLTQRLAKKLASIYKKHFSRPVIHKGKGGDVFIVTMEYIK